MNSTIKRLIGASGAIALAAGAALIAAPAAQADGGYYGAWTLTGWKIGDVKIACPGSLPLPPPAPPLECKAGEILELKSNYRYKTNLEIFGDRLLSKGYFATTKFPKSKYKTITFDADGAVDDPRSYQMKLQGTGAGAPKKMVIFVSIGTGGGEDTMVKMIFRRDAD